MNTDRRVRGAGRIFRRGNAWWIAHYHGGRETREAVAPLLGKRPGECTEDDARRLLAIRTERRDPKLLPLPFGTASFSTIEMALRVAVDRVPRAATIFAAHELRAMFKPIVYAYFRSGDPIYVGASKSGVVRPCSPHHHRLGGVTKEVQDGDHLVIWPVESWADARRLERDVIATLQPRLNGRAR